MENSLGSLEFINLFKIVLNEFELKDNYFKWFT